MAVLRLIRLAPSREAMCADGSGPAYYLKEGDSDVWLGEGSGNGLVKGWKWLGVGGLRLRGFCGRR